MALRHTKCPNNIFEGTPMKFDTMTPEQKERGFAEDVLEWYEGSVYPRILWWMCEGKAIMYQSDFRPLTNLDHAFLGVEKIKPHKLELVWDRNGNCFANLWTTSSVYYQSSFCNKLNEAIVEACLRIKSPHLFEED